MKTLYRTMIAVGALCAGSAAWSAEKTLEWTPSATIEIPLSTGKFDFLRVDLIRHRLLAAHENDGTADYFDLSASRLITRLRVGGAVDTAVDATSTFYYVSVQGSQRVAVIDAGSLKEVKSIKTAGPTDAILYDTKNRHLYVTHDDGAEVWVIDPDKAAVIATIVVPGVPEFMVYDAKADRIYLNIKTKDVVAVIDPNSNTVIARWPTAPALQPHGLALDSGNHRIFSAGGNGKLVAIDTLTGIKTEAIDIVSKVDQIAFDSTNGLLYCAGADRMSLVRVTSAGLTPLGSLVTAATARNVAVDPITHAVWTTFTDGKSSFAKSWIAPPLR